MDQKNVYILSFNGSTSTFIPVLWPSAKTFYELYGNKVDRYNWILPSLEFYNNKEQIKKKISENPPSVFGVSLYAWNYEVSLEICEWVKNTYPKCLIITGGPQQYFKHHDDWFTKHYFVDASLPSEVYGEVAIKDILDNLTEDNTVNWNKVEKIYYPARDRSIFTQSKKSTYKLDFNWNYSAFKKQKSFIDQYVNEYNTLYPKSGLHAKIETTRGCPYQCTFCDWGGGVGTKVVLKDYNAVLDDINVLTDFNIDTLFICDANFGINKDRDVNIIKFLSKIKKQKKKLPCLMFGGMAKTNMHFDYLKQIYIEEAKNNLSAHHKISIQSFDQDVLKNIKRTDLRANEHWEIADYMKENYGYDAYVELIVGLPGVSLDSWYEEFTIPYNKNAFVMVYEWYLLPEAEAYDKNYREKFKLITAKKIETDSKWNIPAEIVVGNFSCTVNDYKQMWIVTALNHLFQQGKIYSESISTLIKKNNLSYGQFLKLAHTEFYNLWKTKENSLQFFERHLDSFVSTEPNKTVITIKWNNKDFTITQSYYFIMEYFKNFNVVDPLFRNFLISYGVDASLVEKESKLIIHEKNLGKKQFTYFKIRSYNKYESAQDFLHVVQSSNNSFASKILVI